MRKRISPLAIAFLVSLIVAKAHAGAYFVNNKHPQAKDTNPGIRQLPFKTISSAVARASAGDTVWVLSVTYWEIIDPPRGGSDPEHPLTIRAIPGTEVVIKGSDLVTDWVLHSGTIWKHSNWQVNSQQVFADGLPLQQIGENCSHNKLIFNSKLSPIIQRAASCMGSHVWGCGLSTPTCKIIKLGIIL